MIWKISGALLIIAGAGGIGFSMSCNHKRDASIRSELIHAIEWMILELNYRMPPLEIVFREAASVCNGSVRQVLEAFASEMEQQTVPDPVFCMHSTLEHTPHLSDSVKTMLLNLSACLGMLDVHGQISALEGVAETWKKDLDHFTQNQDVRLRNYPTMGLCMGAALAILLF